MMKQHSQPKQHISMKKGGFESQLDHHHNDSIFNDFDDDLDSRMQKNMNMPLNRGKNNGSGGGQLKMKNCRSNSRGGRSTAMSSSKGH
jgi:hypothetical protein